MEGDLEIINRLGLHTRAATKLVKLAKEYSSEVTISLGNLHANGKSILGLLSLGASYRKIIHLRCVGSDQEEAFSAIAELIQRGFDEEVGL